MVIDEVKS